uniref:Small ribosomal subunit protein mS29 n=1 Tax=Neogobius melanostomus TaxID=47308 RepID=A0A8C6TQ82_9GOBI
MFYKNLSNHLQVSHARSLHSAVCSQQQEAMPVHSYQEPVSIFRSPEHDPACHTENHIGQFYTVPPSHIKTLFPHGLPPRYQLQIKTFNEACVMIRQPALEVISCLKQMDYNKPAQRYLFYGTNGGGKTMCLSHTVHFCYTQGWLVLHIPDAHRWVKNCKELLQSSYNSARFDQPLQATEWLRNFRITNEPFLSKIKTKHRYLWTKREFTDEGSSLGELVDQGISRVKSSSDVVGAVMKELRLQSGQSEAAFRLAVAVDGVNALWGMSKNISLCAIITSLSQTGSLYTSKTSYLPQELLGERGFDYIDPCVPVSVPNYSEKEFESCYLYYLDRHWLQHPQSQTEEGKKELIFLSNRNPWMLDRIVASL